MRKTSRLFLLILLAAHTILFSCRTIPETEELFPEESLPAVWKDIDRGVQKYEWRAGNAECRIYKIDLSVPVEIKAFPEKSGWQKPEATADFAKKEKLLLCINTNPFERMNARNPFSKTKPIGIIINNGELISGPAEGYTALAFFLQQDGSFRAEIIDDQKIIPDLKPEFAFGGFFTVLRGKTVYQFKNYKNMRSGAAVSDGGKTLYLFAGRKLSYGDTAAIFRNLEAEACIQFDGGHSTSLVIKGRRELKGFIPRKAAAGFGLILSH